MSDYVNYYKRAIELNQSGFKLVLGGTGLGKTSAIKKLIKEYENSDEQRKFIYIANRIQLLNELAEDLPEKYYSHQKNDFDLLSETDMSLFFENHIVKKYIERSKHTKTPIILSDIKKANQTVIGNKDIPKIGNFEEFIRRQTSIVTSFIKQIIQYANRENEDDYQKLIKNKAVLTLFPYIEFKNNQNKRILLVTIQKAFHGFFDGVRQVSLFNLDNLEKNDNGENIIFFDEFDFLENDLISLISEDTDVPFPFNFVAHFYNAMKNNKLPLPNYPADEKIRNKIEKVIESVENLQKKNIDFPTINHFICTQDEQIETEIQELKQKKKTARKKDIKETINEQIKKLKYNRIKGKSIFQTRYTIVNSKLFLNPNTRQGSFDLTKEDNNLSAFTLFRHVNSAVGRIIHLFKELENEYPIYYHEILRHGFETSDTFQRAIKTTKQHPRNKKVLTNYDFLHYNGYNLYEIQDLKQETDKNEIVFNHFAIHTTPEKILLHLAENNFVFGLSATADIPRKLRNFDLAWLKVQLKDNYIDASKNKEDKKDIQTLNEEKSKERKNSVAFKLSKSLDEKEEYQVKLKKFIENVARSKEDIFGSDTGNYRKIRVELFFAALLDIINKNGEKKENLKAETHLMFFSSFKQIEHTIKEKTEDEIPLFTNQRHSIIGKFFEYYEISIKETDFLVVFYDASKGKSITKEEEAKEAYYKLFWQGKPVIIVTTYPSAGNGINLQYYKTESDFQTNESKTDFNNIHLLDSPYFFFDKIEDEKPLQEQNASIKKNIYYYTKLLASKTKLSDTEITVERHFERYLENIRAKYNPFNEIYLKSHDGILNQLAVYIQAIGRIERVWEKMDNQYIYFRREVYELFEMFSTSNDFINVKQKIFPYLSGNLQSLIRLIEEYSKKQNIEIDDWKEEHLEQINQKNRQKISELLTKIAQLNANKLTKHEAETVRRDWNNLRIFGLKHQFDEKILNDYSSIFETDYHKNGEIRINSKNQIISDEFVNYKYNTWKFNSIYDAISKNTIISNYFDNRGYELSFSSNNKFFTPYFYQAILSGAIGEEAIKAIFRELDQVETFDFIKQTINPIPIANDSEIPNELFEIADLKIKDKPYFIDCKNYSERTLSNFDLPQDDPLWHPKLNETYFIEKAILKYKRIKKYYKNQDCKLIYINFIGSEIRTSKYLQVVEDQLIETRDFNNSEIIVIQGVLKQADKKQDYNSYTMEFEKFIIHLNNDLNK